MTVRIDEVSTVIEPGGEPEPGGSTGFSSASGDTIEDQVDQMRMVVRMLVAEEVERWLRTRGEWL